MKFVCPESQNRVLLKCGSIDSGSSSGVAGRTGRVVGIRGRGGLGGIENGLQLRLGGRSGSAQHEGER